MKSYTSTQLMDAALLYNTTIIKIRSKYMSPPEQQDSAGRIRAHSKF